MGDQEILLSEIRRQGIQKMNGIDNKGMLIQENGKLPIMQNGTKNIADGVTSHGVDAFTLVTSAKQKATKWKKISTARRQCKRKGLDKLKGMGGLSDVAASTSYSFTAKELGDNCNRALIHYFANLAENNISDVDLEFVTSLLDSGASINCTDQYGQSIIHEIAREWSVDIAKFLVDRGANINIVDHYGRTPLHVAAAVDYPDMINFLIDHGANKEARTNGDEQTPVHFAAKHDAVRSLKTLVKRGCEFAEARDYKGRTPLHLAAEFDRSDAARLLLDLGAPANVLDNCGQACIVWMICKMAPVAEEALDQFYTKDRTTRKQYFYLNQLEPKRPGETCSGSSQSVLQAIVNCNQIELIMHPCIMHLLEVKWTKYGRFGAWFTLILNLLFALMWTSIAVINATVYLAPFDRCHSDVNGTNNTVYTCQHDDHLDRTYVLPDHWWRILLLTLGFLLWAWQVKDEFVEIYRSNKDFRQWKAWREAEVERDLKYCHPCWTEEEEFLRAEKRDLDHTKPQYFDDKWNIFDWITYIVLLAVVITHVVDIFVHSDFLARFNIRLSSVLVIILWIRVMKNARAFSLLGPFIVMLGTMMGDVVRFIFLYMEFYIPFACVFWMMYGGTKVADDSFKYPNPYFNETVEVDGFNDVNELLFSLFTMTLGGTFDYHNMKRADYIMTDLIIGAWLAISAILCLNLFIALLSDTFARVYENAQANAMMQKAILILTMEEGMSHKQREKFRTFIHEECAPDEKPYGQVTLLSNDEETKKAIIDIREEMEDMRELLLRREVLPSEQDSIDEEGSTVNNVESRKNSHELSMQVMHIRNDFYALNKRQSQLLGDVQDMKKLLEQFVSNQSQGPSLPVNRSQKPLGPARPPGLTLGDQQRYKKSKKGGLQGLPSQQSSIPANQGVGVISSEVQHDPTSSQGTASTHSSNNGHAETSFGFQTEMPPTMQPQVSTGSDSIPIPNFPPPPTYPAVLSYPVDPQQTVDSEAERDDMSSIAGSYDLEHVGTPHSSEVVAQQIRFYQPDSGNVPAVRPVSVTVNVDEMDTSVV